MWLLCLMCFILVQSGYSLRSIPTGAASLDNIIDRVTNNINTKGKGIGLDHYPLPDINKEIKKNNEKPIVFHLTNGVINNLTSIERYGNSLISYKSKILNINVGFHFTQLQVNYDFNIHAWNLNPIGKLKGGLSNFRVITEGNIDLDDFSANLSRLEIPTTGKIDFYVNATVPIYNYIVQNFVNSAALFQDIIIYEIGVEVKKKINEMLKNIEMLSYVDVKDSSSLKFK